LNFLLGPTGFEKRVNTIVDAIMKLDRKKKWEVSIEPAFDKLSDQQRRLYRKWLDEIAAVTGDDAESLHEGFLKSYAPRVVIKLHGEAIEIMKRTSRGKFSMNVPEMSEYMERVQGDAARMEIQLTQPAQDPW
jgi:hypothetical protein